MNRLRSDDRALWIALAIFLLAVAFNVAALAYEQELGQALELAAYLLDSFLLNL